MIGWIIEFCDVIGRIIEYFAMIGWIIELCSLPVSSANEAPHAQVCSDFKQAERRQYFEL